MSILCRNKIFLIIVAAMLLTTVPTAFSQELKLNSYLDTTSILIGDQLKYHIELEQPKKLKVKFPEFQDSIASGIEIIETEPADTSRQGDRLIIRKWYLVTSFDSGYHKIPAFNFAFTLDSRNDSIASQELFLQVNTLPVDTAKEITDIKPVMNTPFSLGEIKHELLIGLLILAIVALIVWIILRRRKSQPVFMSRKPQEPPHVIALRELDLLRNEKLWLKNQIKLYYTRLTDILRIYIFGRYGINAMEMTSEEIIVALKPELNMDMELKSQFSNLLVQADMVKFAKEEPLPEENEVALLSAYTFVNRTKIEVISNIEIEKSETETGKE